MLGLLWKIYKGSKKSTKQEASIFVFEKRQLEKYNKQDRELVLEVLKRGVTQLTKIRHPRILTVQHPLEESRESLAFATEPVFASLANILGQTTNMPQPANMSDYKFFDVEMKYGLLQLGEGLAFLHNDVRLLHRNLAPESVIVNQQGAWKIFGFDFCVHNTSPPNAAPVFPFEGYSPTVPNISQPNLNFLAPECILSSTHSTASDIFSLGMLVYALHSVGGQTLFPVKDVQGCKARVQQLRGLSLNRLQCVPDALREYVKLMLNTAADVRPDAHQFIKVIINYLYKNCLHQFNTAIYNAIVMTQKMIKIGTWKIKNSAFAYSIISYVKIYFYLNNILVVLGQLATQKIVTIYVEKTFNETDTKKRNIILIILIDTYQKLLRKFYTYQLATYQFA